MIRILIKILMLKLVNQDDLYLLKKVLSKRRKLKIPLTFLLKCLLFSIKTNKGCLSSIQKTTLSGFLSRDKESHHGTIK